MMSASSVQEEVDALHHLLFQVERIHHFVTAHEVIDLNSYSVHRNQVIMKRMIREKKNTPFIFISNLN